MIGMPLKREFITFINPTNQKGVNIFLEIAKTMPEKKFLVVGATSYWVERKLKKLKNVTYLGQVKHAKMEDIYKKTRIVLLPSVWHEPFSRVPLEAMDHGIITIASDTGGSSEEIGNAGIVIGDYKNISKWRDAIKKLDNKKVYKTYQRRFHKQLGKFSFKRQFQKYKTILDRNIR